MYMFAERMWDGSRVLQITSPKLVFRDASENYIDMSWNSLVLPCSGAPANFTERGTKFDRLLRMFFFFTRASWRDIQRMSFQTWLPELNARLRSWIRAPGFQSCRKPPAFCCSASPSKKTTITALHYQTKWCAALWCINFSFIEQRMLSNSTDG